MLHIKRKNVLLVVAVALLVLGTGCEIGLATHEFVPRLLVDDFTSYEIGSQPPEWDASGGSDYVYVVSDPDIDSGRAMRMITDPSRDGISIKAPLGNPMPKNVRIISVEHKIKWLEGKNNLYISDGIANHIVHWWITDQGGLGVRDGARSITIPGVTLQTNSWHRIKVVADLVTKKYDIYFDDMIVPVRESLTFRGDLDSWDDMKVLFAISHPDGSYKEHYIGEVEVQVLE